MLIYLGLTAQVAKRKVERIFPGRKAWKDAFALANLHFGLYSPKCNKARPYGLAVE